MSTATPARPTSKTPPVVAEIAAQLGETTVDVKRQIGRAVRVLGEERARSFVTQALEVEAAGGMILPDGSRRRTPGGVFFYLLRGGVDRREAYKIFRPQAIPRGQGTQTATGTQDGGQTPAAVAPSFDWATFSTAATAAMSEAGEATTVKLTVIGRPGNVVERGDVVLVALRSEKAPALPKGVPAPASPQNDYMALVGMKQWRKVAAALAADPADKVIIEGYPTVRPDFAGITVHATGATTTGIQAGKRAAQTATND